MNSNDLNAKKRPSLCRSINFSRRSRFFFRCMVWPESLPFEISGINRGRCAIKCTVLELKLFSFTCELLSGIEVSMI